MCCWCLELENLLERPLRLMKTKHASETGSQSLNRHLTRGSILCDCFLYWKFKYQIALMNHSKCFFGKPQRKLESSKQNCCQTFSFCTSCAATLQHIFSGSDVNFWSASALWEVRSINFTPEAVCTKSLFHKNCLISSSVATESPPEREQTFGLTNPSTLEAPVWRKMESHCVEIISSQGWDEKCFQH